MLYMEYKIPIGMLSIALGILVVYNMIMIGIMSGKTRDVISNEEKVKMEKEKVKNKYLIQ